MAVPAATRPYRVLVCDDQPDVLHAMQLLLKGQGYEAVTVDSPRALLREARSDEFDLILADLNYTRDTTSGEEGLDLLAGLESQGNTAPVIVMTAWGSIDLAVEAMRRGACDFVQKPWDNERVLAAIRKQADSERGRQSELEIAATVQQKLFPRAAHRLRTIDYAGQCVAARGVGGDYYDFLDLGDEPGESSMGFVLADVSGERRPRGAADGESASLLPDPSGRRRAPPGRAAGSRPQALLLIHGIRPVRHAVFRLL